MSGKKKNHSVALITGATSGIGEMIVAHLLQHDFVVILLGRQKTTLKKLQVKLDCSEGTACSYVLDITDEGAIKDILRKIIKRFKRIDVLVNAAGVYYDKPLASTSLRQWMQILSTNLTGLFLMCKYVSKHMMRQRTGTIINFSSIGGKIPLKNRSCYCASKFGVVGFTKSIAKELKPYRIKVHLVSPYLVDSKNEINWKKAHNEFSIMRPEDIAHIIDFLLSLPMRSHIPDLDIIPFMY